MELKLIKEEPKNIEVKFFRVKDSASCRTAAIKVHEIRLDAYQKRMVDEAKRRYRNLYVKNFHEGNDYIIVVSEYTLNIIGDAYASSLEYLNFDEYKKDCDRVCSLRRGRAVQETVNIELG